MAGVDLELGLTLELTGIGICWIHGWMEGWIYHNHTRLDQFPAAVHTMDV